MCVITLFVVFKIKELLGMLKEIVEIGMIYVPAVDLGISSDRRTGIIFWKYCRTLISLLFDWHMLLVQLLLCVGGGEKINHSRQ